MKVNNMKIKPIYKNTIQSSNNDFELFSSKKNKTNISKEVHKIIFWEKTIQILILSLSFLFIISSLIWIILYQTVISISSWTNYIIPSIVLFLSFIKMLTTFFERTRILNDVKRYEENLQKDIDTTPPFIKNIYYKLNIKQVKHNWITLFSIFYGGLITIMLWLLKDVSWWVFNFKTWIEHIFSNPNRMIFIFSFFIILISVIHIIFAIQRKKKMLDIYSYFGSKLGTLQEIESIKQSKNKLYRRIFITSLMFFLIIPLLIYFILKIKKK